MRILFPSLVGESFANFLNSLIKSQQERTQVYKKVSSGKKQSWQICWSREKGLSAQLLKVWRWITAYLDMFVVLNEGWHLFSLTGCISWTAMWLAVTEQNHLLAPGNLTKSDASDFYLVHFQCKLAKCTNFIYSSWAQSKTDRFRHAYSAFLLLSLLELVSSAFSQGKPDVTWGIHERFSWPLFLFIKAASGRLIWVDRHKPILMPSCMLLLTILVD